MSILLFGNAFVKVFFYIYIFTLKVVVGRFIVMLIRLDRPSLVKDIHTQMKF